MKYNVGAGIQKRSNILRYTMAKQSACFDCGSIQSNAANGAWNRETERDRLTLKHTVKQITLYVRFFFIILLCVGIIHFRHSNFVLRSHIFHMSSIGYRLASYSDGTNKEDWRVETIRRGRNRM